MVIKVNSSVIKVKCLISYIVICNIGELLTDWLKSNIVTTLTYYFYLTGVRQNDVRW